MPECEKCEHFTDDDCIRPGMCAYCGNGFCYCDPIVETDDGEMHKACAAAV